MNLPLKKYSSIFWTLVFLILSANTFAQSSYYWTQNFNTESSLLAGAVVGGNAGASAVYYNPALINQKESNKLALSANLVSLKSMKLDNLAGTGADYRALKLQFQPKFISYTGVSKKDSKLIYELAFLVPLHLDVEYNFVSNQNLDIIKRLDGNEDYLGELNFKNAYDDYYVGGGVSYRLSDRISVGGSVFISYKQMDYAAGLDLKALQNSDTVYSNGAPEPFYIAQNSYSEKLEYTDVSLVTKLGVHYNSPNGRWGFGLNLTLSNLRVYGSGDVQKEFYRSNVYDDSEDEFTKDLAFTNIQEEIKTQIKDPLSLAFGFQYRSPKENHSIFFTTEYFFAIDKYAMLETIDNISIGNLQFENTSKVMNFNAAAGQVFNFAIGLDQFISDKLTINGGFKTDFNAFVGDRQKVIGSQDIEPILSSVVFNQYHIIIGPSFKVKKFGVVLGVQYTRGRNKDLYNLAFFNEPIEYNPETNQSLQGVRQQNMNLRYNEISIFFGITYGLGR